MSDPIAREAGAASQGHAVRHSIIEANGGTFHVVEQGSGPAVLFLHGWPDTAEGWHSQMQAVAEAGYRAIALDMRGFGESYAPADPELYSATYIVGDLVGILDALDISEVVIVSHDWGADHGQRAMLMRPDRFRAIVSLAIPFMPRGDLSTWDALRSRGLSDSYYAFDIMELETDQRISDAACTIPSALYWTSGSPPEGSGWDPLDAERGMFRPAPQTLPAWIDADYLRHNVEAFRRTGFHSGLNHYRGVQATFDQLGAYKGMTIKQPSLYIWGAADGLCNLLHPGRPSLEDFRKNAPGLADAIRLEGVGHWPQQEARERVNAEITRFLRGLDG